RRPHSEAELRRKLAYRGCGPDDVELAVARMRALGYLDDAAFARSLVAWRARRRGPALIAAELASRGVSRELAQAAVAELEREDQLAAAGRLVRGGRDDPRQAAARLRRSGFAPDVIRAVLGLDPED